MRKEGAAQSFMDWEFERCNYEQLADLLMEHLGSMAEHNFMASWNYVQYKKAKHSKSCYSSAWLCIKLLVPTSE